MRVFLRLIGYMKPYLLQMVLATVALGLAGAIMSGVVATFKPLVNEVLLASSVADQEPAEHETDLVSETLDFLPLEWLQGWIHERPFVKVPVLFVALFLIRGVLLYLGQYLTTKAGASVIRDLRKRLFDSIVTQSLSFFRQHSTGVVLSRVLNDVQQVQRVSTFVLADLVRVGAMAPCMLVVVLIHDWRMSIFAMIVLPFFAYPTVRLGKRLRKASRRSQEQTAEASSLLTETVSGIKVVQAFCMEQVRRRHFGEAINRVLKVDLQAGRAAALSEPIMEQIGAAAGAVLFVFAGVNIAKQRLDPGNFVVVLAGLSFLLMSLRRLNKVNIEVQRALAAATRIFAMIDWQPEIQDAPDAYELPEVPCELVFDNVEFSFTTNEKVLDGINLSIAPGEMVALVGPSGAGKTTLANLVLRYFDPTGGRILFSSHDIARVTLSSLRSKIGIVTQETVLFDDTLDANISGFRPEVPHDKVVAAAKAAQAHDFIMQLPQGYDTTIGECGSLLSMGQRQRIAIARAVLKDPPLLILDEATSSLDAESESLVQRALETLLEGRSSLVIAHRLATVRIASRILVMDKGRIVEEGTHDELIAADGLYARLHELQFQE